MNELLEQFAAAYAAREEELPGFAEGRSGLHYPAAFLFIGDRATEAASALTELNGHKYDNAAGIAYFHIASSALPEDGLDRHRQGVRFRWDAFGGRGAEENTLRRDTHRAFVNAQADHLYELNRALRRSSRMLSESGRLFASFDRLHLSVVAHADDVMNVLTPEISLLAASVFGQSFKSVQTDLYVLVSDQEQSDSFGYSSSVGVSFLRELDLMQRPEYAFSAPLQVTENRLTIDVNHAPSPLFDLVYLLSDKNERGIAAPGGLRGGYEIICHAHLLKNRRRDGGSAAGLAGTAGSAEEQPLEGLKSGAGQYNNSAFKSGLSDESGRRGLASGGFARVTRPDRSIALAVLYHYARGLNRRMREIPETPAAEQLARLELDRPHMRERAGRLAPGEDVLADMNGIMSSSASYASIRRMTLAEAEETLFGKAAESFFRGNFEAEAQRRMAEADIGRGLRQYAERAAAEDARHGLHRIAAWSDPSESAGGAAQALLERMREAMMERDGAKEELDRLYGGLVEEQPHKKAILRDSQNVRNFVRYFFEHVYGLKLQILRLELEIELYRRYEDALTALHGPYKAMVRRTEHLEERLRRAAEYSAKSADDYIGQNLMPYYERVVDGLMRDAEDRRGRDYYFEERRLGDLAALIADRPEDGGGAEGGGAGSGRAYGAGSASEASGGSAGLASSAGSASGEAGRSASAGSSYPAAYSGGVLSGMSEAGLPPMNAGERRLLERLAELCNRELLGAEPLVQTYEEELLRRANVAVEYENRETMTKEDLFRILYRKLEERASINLRLFDYTQEHRHEEKYFFGDGNGEFMRYALNEEETSRIYRVGYVHERRSDGVEKLNLMGGFHIEDLMYYRNGRVYYDAYVKAGYLFHAIDSGSLPEI
ncbi:transcription initiation factor TFIID [Saccharibacillus sp. CPCC 101409]|uniref:transcription initiation factor TFIID n=1 Tax=Saccharibacillus sp. CPCC 101409 TaxID=3058041 RepID=UPI002671BF52|nr:transcription initiation factor TFIID [Saccharibacillus sp. CPCC 101409]MDO3412738.1 transcription initiation factor TFIID [Saccharibacillus sp. CPCC 101409]